MSLEIRSVLPLFEKYLLLFKNLREFDIELKFKKLEFLVIYYLLPMFQTFQLFHYIFPQDPNKRKKKEKPTTTTVDCVRQPQLLIVWVLRKGELYHNTRVSFSRVARCDFLWYSNFLKLEFHVLKTGALLNISQIMVKHC